MSQYNPKPFKKSPKSYLIMAPTARSQLMNFPITSFIRMKAYRLVERMKMKDRDKPSVSDRQFVYCKKVEKSNVSVKKNIK
jgi:hypothetical protein